MDENRENSDGPVDNPEVNLKDARERIRLLYEQSPFAYQSLDKEGFIRDVNFAWQEMLGYKHSQVVGKWIGDFLTAKSKEKFKKRFPKFLSNGRMRAAVFEMLRSDGSTIAVEVNGKIGTDKDGQFQQTHCILRDITKQKEAEDKLRLLSSIVHNCREGIAVIDLDRNILFMNQSFAQMHGFKPAELFGKNITVIHTAEQMPDVDNSLKEVLQKGEFKGQIWHKRKDGTVFPCLMHVSVLSDGSGGPIGIAGIMLDISDLKQKEAEIIRQRDLAQQYLDIAGVILIVIGADHKVKLINKMGCQILGFGQEDIIGKDWFENFIEPKERDKVKATFDSLMKGQMKSTEYFVNTVLTRNRGVRIIAWHNTVLMDSNNQITGTLSSGQDITEQSKAEKWLRYQHSLAVALSRTNDMKAALQMILKTALRLDEIDTGGIYLVDEKTGGLDLVVFDGPSEQFIKKVSHYEAKDLHIKIVMEGKALYMVSSEYMPEVREKLVEEGLRSFVVLPITYEKKVIGSLNLASRNYDQISAASRKEAEILAAQVGGVVARIKAQQALNNAYNDLERKVQERTAELSKAYKDLEAETATRQMKEKMLRENEKFAAAGRLAARIAHEINNPIAGIKNAFLLIKDAVPSDYKYYNYVDMIENEISRVSRIVRQMLELYKPQQESPAELKIIDVIKDVIELHKIACPQHSVKIEIEAPDLLVANLTEGMLKQVLFNLIDNAEKASKPDGIIKISALVSENNLIIKVADNGIGIEKDVQDKIFEPFFNTQSNNYKRGLGLGLAITKSIIDAMGGSISFESEYGKGTVFTLTVPINGGKELI